MNFLERVQTVLVAESQAIMQIPSDTLINKLPLLAEMILNCKGKTIITGVGKNGSVAERVAATLSCTGTPSCYLSPLNAVHGDLGMLSSGDILLALSNSGRTQEIIDVVMQVRKYFTDVKIIILTGHPEHTLSQYADLSISYGIVEEPCPLGLTPSASLAVMSALLDALALGIMEQRGFTKADFARNHKFGYIAEKIKAENQNTDIH